MPIYIKLMIIFAILSLIFFGITWKAVLLWFLVSNWFYVSWLVIHYYNEYKKKRNTRIMYALFKDGKCISLRYLTKKITRAVARACGYLDKNDKLKKGYTIEKVGE